MSPTASSRARARQAARSQGAPTLRLVQEEPQPAELPAQEQAERDVPNILIVGAGARRRALVRKDLAEALAPDTQFAEADNVWEVLQQVPRSGVVMLAGDLPDVSAGTLMELLGRRHPWLPIVVLDAPDAESQAGLALAGHGDMRGSRED